jgi:hypothetical protein
LSNEKPTKSFLNFNLFQNPKHKKYFSKFYQTRPTFTAHTNILSIKFSFKMNLSLGRTTSHPTYKNMLEHVINTCLERVWLDSLSRLPARTISSVLGQKFSHKIFTLFPFPLSSLGRKSQNPIFLLHRLDLFYTKRPNLFIHSNSRVTDMCGFGPSLSTAC